VALANPRTARSLMRVGLALAEARGARTVAVSVAPVGPGHVAEATPAVRRLRLMVRRMVEMATAQGQQVTGLVRAARSIPEGLTEVVREQAWRSTREATSQTSPAGDGSAGHEAEPLLVLGWPANAGATGEGSGLLGLLAAGPPCDLLFVHGRVPRRWRGVVLAQRGGPHTELAQQVALDLAGMGGALPRDGLSELGVRSRTPVGTTQGEVPANESAIPPTRVQDSPTGAGQQPPALLTALHVVPDYLSSAAAAVEEAAFTTYWTRDEPVTTRPRLVRAPAAAPAVVRESRRGDLLVLDAAPTTRAYPYPLGRTTQEIIDAARPPVLVAKASAARMAVYGVTTGETRRPGGDATSQPATSEATSHASAATSQPPPTSPAAGSGAPPGAVPSVDRWFAEQTFAAREFANVAELAALKQRLGVKVAVALVTAYDIEGGEDLIGQIIRGLQSELGPRGDSPLVDEIVVIDSGSPDDTLAVANSLGATALDARNVLRAAGSFRGRGEALWKTLSVVTSDLLVCLNPLVVAGASRAVCALLGPLLLDSRLHLVAGFSRRALRVSPPGAELPAELVVRPLLNLLFPELAGLISPLPGDYAARTSTLRGLPIVSGEGVELGLLLDALGRHGLEALAQVDLEGRPPREYEPRLQGRLAFALVQVLMRRLDERHSEVRLLGPLHHVLRLPYLQEDGYGLDTADVPEIERPPLDEWLANARTAGQPA
jgi:hypothetical protein